MIRNVAIAAIGLFMTTGIGAQDLSIHKEQFNLVADAVTSAQTCSQMGYKVDFDGIVELKALVRDNAVADGMDGAEADRLQEDSIARKYVWLKKKFDRADRMVKEADSRRRHKRFWTDRCEQLSKDDRIARFFRKT